MGVIRSKILVTVDEHNIFYFIEYKTEIILLKYHFLRDSLYLVP